MSGPMYGEGEPVSYGEGDDLVPSETFTGEMPDPNAGDALAYDESRGEHDDEGGE